MNFSFVSESDIASMLDFLKFFLPLAAGAFAWFWNERRKRADEEYERKEKKYALLIESLQGFYNHSAASETGIKLKAQFLDELNKCWLYCPDEVIHKAYAFLSKVHTEQPYSDEEKEHAVGELVLAIRKDLISRKTLRNTSLTPSDFKHLKVN